MKELSIEEKAKRYDEAITRAKVWKEKSGMPADRQGILDDVFPELKESEDEMLRKMLIKFIKGSHSATFPWGGFEREQILAWLEKQGEYEEQKSNDIYPIFRVGDYIRNKKTSDKVLIEQLDIATKAYCYVSYDGAAVNHSDFPFSKQDEWELIGQKNIEQKPILSEEDSPYYDDICEILINLLHSETADVNKDAIQKDLDWFISLEERVQPQPKQEWSEEDSMFIKILRTMIAAYVKDDEERKKLVRWLDIHCNAYPIPNKLYPSWKPSDEQMADLWNMVCECRPADQQLLQDIYYGLKTLRGE